MERFPTWQVWKLLHTFPSPEMYELLSRVLRVKHSVNGTTFLNEVFLWVILGIFLYPTNTINLGFLYIDFSVWDIQVGQVTINLLNFVLPTFITVIALRYALQVVSAVQR